MRVYHDPVTEKVRFTFTGDVNAAPPGDFIEVPDDTDVSSLESLRVQNDVLVFVDLEPKKRDAIDYINGSIGDARAKFITNSFGQSMIYNEKYAESVTYLAEDPEPATLDDYPFIAAEIGSTAETAYEVAQIYVNKAAQLRQIGAALEQIRIGSITFIESAVTKEEIDQAVIDFRTQMSAM